MSIPKLYTVDEVSKLACAPRSTVQFWLYSGQLKGSKVGRRRLISETELLRFLGLLPPQSRAHRPRVQPRATTATR